MMDKHCGNCKYYGEVIEDNLHSCNNNKSIFKVCLETATGCEKFEPQESDDKRPSIDDEPELHAPQQASTGIYIPDTFYEKSYKELLEENTKLHNAFSEYNRLLGENGELRNVITAAYSMLTSSHYTKKDIRDRLKPYIGRR